MKKNYGFLLVLILFTAVSAYSQTVVKPGIKTSTSFAIIIDSTSYSKTQHAVDAYKEVIEKDNLGSYIIADNWKSPDDIKAILWKLYNDKKMPLEGAVFIGDIPIPMLRDAQHLTSAFKMDQQRDWTQSSIPSDRFYDDFDLKFDFLKQDENRPELFYYSLRHDGSQQLNSDIYTGRIRLYDNEKGNKYTQLIAYLQKVVNERTENRNNILDYLSMGRGHGYNSESKVAWAGEQIALKEQLPYVFSSQGKTKFMDFDSRWPIKEYFIAEVQQPDLDVMIFHHHGDTDMQYLNGYKEGSDPTTSIENIQLYIRSKVRSAVRRGSTLEEAIDNYVKSLGIPYAWGENALDSATIAEDSLYNLMLDINMNDIYAMKPNARFIVFDACFNGSFHEKENVAGGYVFNDGKTIAAQANTVNVVQDKWPDELIGLLSAGLRVGAWNQQVNYLETHIIGDPTFRFRNNTSIDFDLNSAIKLKAKDNDFWLKQLESENADLKALALKMLYNNHYNGISDLSKKIYMQSDDMIPRTEALMIVSKLTNKNFTDVLKQAHQDSYELIRRFAVEYICKNGSNELIPAFVHSILWDNTSERVAFKQRNFMELLELDKVKTEIEKQTSDCPFYNKKEVEEWLDFIDKTEKSFEKSMEIITGKDTSATLKAKKLELKGFRNKPATKSIGQLLQIANDSLENEELRLTAIEALGWFNYSYRKNEIIEGLLPLTDESNKNEAIRKEAVKTIHRLK